MSWLGRAISSVGQYYKEINPATLSGAIDVIVVSNKRTIEKEHGKASEGNNLVVEDLACSPWHVRFGKLSVLRPVERKVRILINDQPAPFSMKIGETGEAFFVFETDVDDLPDDLQTSPLVSPCLRAVEEAQQETPQQQQIRTGREEDGEEAFEGVPEFNDLGESELRKWIEGKEEELEVVQDSCEADGPTMMEKTEEEQVNRTERSQQISPQEHLDSARDHHQAQLDTTIPTAQVDVDEKPCAPKSREDGEEVRAAARAQVSPILDTQSMPHHIHQGVNLPPGDLMLDMEGYKMSENAEEDLSKSSNIVPPSTVEKKDSHTDDRSLPLSSPSGPSSLEDHSYADINQEQIMAFTKALLTCSERINNLLSSTECGSSSTVKKKVQVLIDSIQNEVTPPDLSLAEFDTTDSKPDTIVDDDEDSDCVFLVERVVDTDGLDPYDKFEIKDNGTSHVFELSLYTPFVNDQQQTTASATHHHRSPFNRKKFNENRILFEDFFTADQTGRKDETDNNILVKYNEMYILSWDNASTALTSLSIYRKSVMTLSQTKTLQVIDGAARIVHHSAPKDSPANQAAPVQPPDKPSPSYSRSWSRWWSKNDRLSSTEIQRFRHQSEEAFEPKDQAHNSAPVYPPDSPRSLPDQFQSERDTSQSPDRKRSTSVLPENKEQGTAEPMRSESPPRKHYAKTLRLTSDQLKQLGLNKGMNTVSFSVRSSYSGYAVCTSRIFLLDSDIKICISDIDGTITKSDALGHVFTMIGRDWTHAGVAKLYTDIARNGYKLMYLTSRAIGQADTTREYLKGINQCGFTLPDGPVIMSPDRLMTSLHREVIMRKPEVFKMACLRDIQRLFGPDRKPFYAGFGNRITDALSYRTVEIPSSRIFTIDSNGEVKMELLELTGYKSSYIHMTDLVDQMFPPINRSSTMPEFTDFNFWRDDLSSVELDLTFLLAPSNASQLAVAPVSPPLSAKSLESSTAVSRLSFRLANLSLVRKVSKPDLEQKRGVRETSPAVKVGLESDAASLRSRDTTAAIEEGPESEGLSGTVPARMRSDSMPGSLPGSLEEQSLLDSLRAEAFEINPRRKRIGGEAEAEGEQVDDNGDDGDVEEGECNVEEEDDDFPQMDFSGVPYL